MTMTLPAAAVVEPREPCSHEPACPGWERPDHDAAKVVDPHPELGYERLCNGVYLFDDGGEILPNGAVVAAHSSEPPSRKIEHWRPVAGWESEYEVSDHGRVRNPRTGRVLSTYPLANGGYPSVQLHRAGRRTPPLAVHRLVAPAFIGPRPAGQHCRHLDGDPTNNHVTNLAWGTASENQLDKVRHGRHPHANKTHCPSGHPYSEENTRIHARGYRVCIQCARTSNRERMAKLRASHRIGVAR